MNPALPATLPLWTAPHGSVASSGLPKVLTVAEPASHLKDLLVPDRVTLAGGVSTAAAPTSVPLASKPLAAASASLTRGGVVAPHTRWSRVLLGATLGAAFGAGVGSGTALVYAAKGMEVGTALHMGIIAGGGAVNTAIVGKALENKVGRPECYVLGGLIGTGFTWATSAFGMLGHPVLGAVAGGTLGALYGGFGALLTN